MIGYNSPSPCTYVCYFHALFDRDLGVDNVTQLFPPYQMLCIQSMKLRFRNTPKYSKDVTTNLKEARYPRPRTYSLLEDIIVNSEDRRHIQEADMGRHADD